MFEGVDATSLNGALLDHCVKLHLWYNFELFDEK
jgi:hypothetical protein